MVWEVVFSMITGAAVGWGDVDITVAWFDDGKVLAFGDAVEHEEF